jgi:predicted phosphate transport protein (TIGR00153 family)
LGSPKKHEEGKMKKIDVPPLFGRTSTLIHQIDEFLDRVAEGAMVFEEGIGILAERGVDEGCEVKLQHLNELKKSASKLGRDIVTNLYAQMLVPDARADILELIAALNRVIDILHHKFTDITIFRAEVPDEIKSGFMELTSAVAKTVDSTTKAARAYFKDINTVRDHIHKISHHESASDEAAIRLKKQIFSSGLNFERKWILSNSVNQIDEIADEAEHIGDRLSIYSIKRSL